MSGTTRIFHITTAADWARALTCGEYAADSLLAEGFIHCSVGNESHRGLT